MKITKFEHSCLLVEMPEPTNRTALFDPGAMSESALDIDQLVYLDDIIVTHSHADHYHMPLIKALAAKFPHVRITAPADVVADLKQHQIVASSEAPKGVSFFTAPHETVEPLFPRPQQVGIHYLDRLSHPGDSHSFTETKQILALPVSGPWASTVTAVNVALKLQPEYVVPIHDWHWNNQARQQMYQGMDEAFKQQGIKFISLKVGEPVVIDD